MVLALLLLLVMSGRPTRAATGPLPEWPKEMGSLEESPKKPVKHSESPSAARLRHFRREYVARRRLVVAGP